jgi:hypothetical protein
MAASASWYGQGILGSWSSTSARRIDWDADTIKTSLHTSSYTPNPDSNDFWDDATNEITGTGYTGDGFTHTTSAVSLDTASNEVRLDANDAAWASAAFTARLSVTYKDTGTNSTSPLICYLDFGADETVSGPGTFTITWDSTGIAKLVYA